jgi:hypothetical protein
MTRVKPVREDDRCMRCGSERLALRPDPALNVVAEIYCVNCTKKCRNIGKHEFLEYDGSFMQPFEAYRPGLAITLMCFDRPDIWGIDAIVWSTKPRGQNGAIDWRPWDGELVVKIALCGGASEMLIVVDHEVRSAGAGNEDMRESARRDALMRKYLT